MPDKDVITHAFGWQLDKGKQRADNQDSLGAAKVKMVSEDADRSIGLYMVADGIGGMAEGGKASKIAIETAMQEVMNHINQQDDAEQISTWLKAAAHMAHRAIRLQQTKKDSQGTTLVMAAVIEDTVFIVNIGDSRAYLIQNGEMRQVTRDHTLAQAFVEQGIIKPEEADEHPYSHVLSQALGVDEIEGDTYIENVRAGDSLLLCSDGLYGSVPADEMRDTILNAESPQDASELLAQAANEAGGRDNIAVIVVRVHERE